MANGPGGKESRPWFKLYPRDFLASPKVARMDAEERGVYVTLLMRSWIDDGVVVDPVELADELAMEPEEVDLILKGRVGRCFVRDPEGRWRNPRLEEERKQARAVSAKRKAAGAKGGRASAKPAEASADQLVSKNKPPESESVSGSESCDPQALVESPTVPKRRASAPRFTEKELEGVIQIAGLDEPTAEAARAWFLYRRQVLKSQWHRSTWAKRLQQAARDPQLFQAAVKHSIDQQYQGLFPPKDGGAGLVKAGGAPVNPAALSYQVQNELLNQKRREEIDAWVNEPDTIDAEGGERRDS